LALNLPVGILERSGLDDRDDGPATAFDVDGEMEGSSRIGLGEGETKMEDRLFTGTGM